jgi:hypothetical protein
MPDYAKTIIYKLINYDYPDLVYVGSTTDFTNRKRYHKCNCYNEKAKGYNLKVYKMIRDNDGWKNWNMIKICDYPCCNKREAEKEEDKHMLELKANMNSHRASRTQKKYYEDNKEKIQEYEKEYYENHKDKIKEYNEINKDKIKEYRDNNKDYYKVYNKEYQETNKDKLKEKRKEYYETNKTTILKNMKEIVKCECGCEVSKSNLKIHQTSKKHVSLMKCIYKNIIF